MKNLSSKLRVEIVEIARCRGRGMRKRGAAIHETGEQYFLGRKVRDISYKSVGVTYDRLCESKSPTT